MNTETLVNTLISFRDKLASTMLEDKKAGSPKWDSLLSELDSIVDMFEIPVELDPAYLKKSSIIDRLGLSFQVIQLYQSDYKNDQIAEVLSNQTGISVGAGEVKRWLDSNKDKIIVDRPQAVRGSIFDTQSRMQEIFESLYERLDRIRLKEEDAYSRNKISKDEVELEFLKEIRQLTKDAASIVSAVSTMSRIKEFQQMVVEVIGQCSPSAQQQILRKLNEHRSLMGSLIPPD